MTSMSVADSFRASVGFRVYASKQYDEAIAYYTKAIECEEQAVFYSNRAACPLPSSVRMGCGSVRV
jgi:hypothetical protein